MNLNHTINQLSSNAQAIHALASGIDTEQARWRPNPASWSILEVINHLYDEEREDFRAHLDWVLHRPDRPWSPIDPQAWVSERRYNDRDLKTSLENFLAAREQSLDWLRSLQAPDWQAAFQASWGQLTAGDLVVSWVAHDWLHTRQLVELRYLYHAQASQPFRADYAGDW